MTANQDFIIKLLTILMPFLSLIVTGILAMLQIRAGKERRQILVKQTEIAHSINGMQEKLIASTAADAFQQGATSERLSPEAKNNKDPL